MMPPFEGPTGLGWANAPGLPRLESCTFTGDFPFARVEFQDSELPVRVTLEAFSPFIPLDADDSGLPIVVMRYRVSNPQTSAVRASIAFSIDNPVGQKRLSGADFTPGYGRINEYRKGDGVEGLLMKNPFMSASDPFAGTFAVSVLSDQAGTVTYLRGWPSAKFYEPCLLFWNDFSSDGELGPETAIYGARRFHLPQKGNRRSRRDGVYLLAHLAFSKSYSRAVRLGRTERPRERSHREFLLHQIRRRLASG